MIERFSLNEQWLQDCLTDEGEWFYEISKEYADYVLEDISKIDLDRCIAQAKGSDESEWLIFDEANEFPLLGSVPQLNQIASPHSIRDHIVYEEPTLYWATNWGQLFLDYEKNDGWKLSSEICVDSVSGLAFVELDIEIDKLHEFCLYFNPLFLPYNEYNVLKYCYSNDEKAYSAEKGEWDIYEDCEEMLILVPNWNVIKRLEGKRENPFQNWFDKLQLK